MELRACREGILLRRSRFWFCNDCGNCPVPCIVEPVGMDVCGRCVVTGMPKDDQRQTQTGRKHRFRR